MPAAADRQLAKHREELRDVLIDLFEKPIPSNEPNIRELLCSVLGRPDLGFAKPIFDLDDNPHLSSLVQAGVAPCVWEEKLLHDKGSRSVLTITTAATEGQELLFDFLGIYPYKVHTLNVRCLFSERLFCAESLCVIDGKMQVSPPIISQDQQLVHHNLLLAHLFVALTRAPAMQRCEINPAKLRTINALMDATFPPIASTADVPTPYVTPRTIACIHALIVDIISLHPSPPLRERALLNETMVLDVLNEMSPQAFREELFTVLNQYHVQILKTASASGRPGTKTFRRSFGAAAALIAAEVTDAGEGRVADPPAPPAAAAEAPAAPVATAAPTKAAPPGRGGKGKTG